MFGGDVYSHFDIQSFDIIHFQVDVTVSTAMVIV